MKILISTNAVLKKRLLGAVESMEYEISQFNWDNHPEKKEIAETALKEAKRYAKKCEFDLAWNQFNIAEQHLVRSMDQNQLNIKAAMLQKEATKITGWRKEQLDFLLGASDKPPITPITVNNLLTAMKVRDDFYNTRNHKMSLHRASVNTLTLLICTILIIILILYCTLDCYRAESLAKTMILSGLFGSLGAGFSIAHSFFSFSLETKIPEQLLGIAVTTIRFVIGATSAIILLFLFKSGFLDNIFSAAILQADNVYIVFSFVAGFSERWVINMLGLVVKDK